jgi:hypothetical protein
MKRALGLVIALVTVLGVTTADAGAATEVVSSGPVTATLSYVKKDDITFTDMRLKIVRNGVVGLDGPINSEPCATGCTPGSEVFGEDSKSIKVVDLDGDGEPEVILDLYTGGAHCCFVSEIYSLQGPPATTVVPTYGQVEHNWFDPYYTLHDLNGDGIPEFDSADGRFNYALSSYAGSGVPVQIFRFQHGTLEDVTGEFPALVRKDSKHWFTVYKRNIKRRPPLNDPGLGALAAWAGDEYRLGHGAKVQAELKRALKHGWLDGIFGSGRRAVRNLNTLLSQTGYR